MWLIALGSATHKQSSCAHVPMVSVKKSGAKSWGTYPKRTVPTNDVPEILEEPLLYSSSIFGQDIPLVSLGGFRSSSTDVRRRERVKSTLRGRTKNPRWVHRPWYILDRRKPPTPSKKDIGEDNHTSRERCKLRLHSQLVVRALLRNGVGRLRVSSDRPPEPIGQNR